MPGQQLFQFRVRLRLAFGIVVPEESPAGLLAQPVLFDQVDENGRGFVPVAERLVHHRAGVQGRVQAHHVVQGDWSHGHAEPRGCLFDFGDGHPLADELQGFVHVGEQHPVDQKARAVLEHDGRFAQPLGERHRGGHRFVGGLVAANHFHQRHPPHGIEKVDAAEPLRVFQRLGQPVDGNGGGIGGNQGLFSHQRFHLGQQLGFHVGVFHHGFQHQLGRGDFFVSQRAVEPGGQLQQALAAGTAQLAVVGGFFQRVAHAPFQCFGLGVGQGHFQPPFQRRGGNPRAHDPGPVNPQRIDLAGLDSRIVHARVFFVPVREEKHVDQRAVDRRAEQRGEPFGFQAAGSFQVQRGGFDHRFQGGHRGRVVSFGLLLDVGAARGGQKGQLGFADFNGLAPPLAVFAVLARFGFGPNHVDGRGHQPFGRDQVFGQAQLVGFCPGDRIAAANHLHGVGEPNHSRQPGGSAPTGEQAQFHFGEADLGFRVVGHHPAIAPGGQFGPSAHAHPGDSRHGDKRGAGQSGEQLLASAAHLLDPFRFGVFRGGELAQVGPGDEDARLARTENQPGQIVPAQQLVQVLFQLLQHALGEHVGPAVRIVEGQLGNVAFGKIETHSGGGHGEGLVNPAPSGVTGVTFRPLKLAAL